MLNETEIAGNETEVTNTAATDAVEVEAVADIEEKTEGAEKTQEDEGDDAIGSDVESELKTVRKALDKRNRYINNQRNRIRALEAEMQKLKDGFSQKKADAPQLEKFESALDYLKADQSYNLEQKLAEQEHAQKMSALEQQQKIALQQHVQEVETQVRELLSSNPDFKQVISANADAINAMPAHIETMMQELDDSPAATYALAKEGRLQSLYSMPPHLAAAHLVQAEIRGQQYLQQSAPPKHVQPAQPAPKPIGSIKGSGKASTKSLDQMSPDELGKWLRS